MSPAFTVRTNSRYDRLAKTVQRRHPEFVTRHRSTLQILATDPYNRSRSHDIKKLEGVSEGDGQYRLALGRWRFRYDIFGTVVLLSYCGLRRESTY
jgi:hypothetical protein